MSTFYAIHAYDQESCNGTDLIENYKLYTTFEKATEALIVYIHRYIHRHNQNKRSMDEEEIFQKPMISMKDGHDYCHYYESYENILFTITRHVVDE